MSKEIASIVAAQVQAADFDHVFTLTRKGEVDWALTEPSGVYAPSVTATESGGVEIDDARWESITDGMSGQYSYSGPVMHESEFIGEAIGAELLRLAEDGPVTFTVVVVGTDDPDHDAGWAVVRLKTPEPSKESGFPELAAEFTQWEKVRAAYGETDGTPDGPSSSQWQASDDDAVDLLRGMAVKVRALNAAVSDVEMLDSTVWSDVAGHFSCTEASVLADLFVALGLTHDAEMLMTGHYYDDGAEEEEEIESHTDSDGVRDERIRPGILFDEGTEPY